MEKGSGFWLLPFLQRSTQLEAARKHAKPICWVSTFKIKS
jgi:hypothetical protein